MATELLTQDFTCVQCGEPEGGGLLVQVTDDDCGRLVHDGLCAARHLAAEHEWKPCTHCDSTGGYAVPAIWAGRMEGSEPGDWEDCPRCDGVGAIP